MNLPDSRNTSHKKDRSRASLAIIDQMIVSGTNFLILAALGRFSGAASLGLFSIGFSIVMITTTAIRSLFMTPYAVFAHRETDERRPGMRTAVLIGCASISCVLSAVGVLIGILLLQRGESTGRFIILTSLTISAWTARELTRQVSFADIQFVRALVTDAVTSGLQLGLIGMLITAGRLSAISAMAVLFFSCLSTGLIWLITFKRDFRLCAKKLRDDAARFWQFGRWGAMGQASHVAQSYCLLWILAWFGGLNASGIYAAVWSIVQLASPFVQGAGNALTPLLAKGLAEGGRPRLVQATLKFANYAVVACVLYLVAIYLIGPHLMQLIYGPKYGNTLVSLMLLATATSLSAIALVPTKVISVLEYPQFNFVMNLLGLVMTTFFAGVLGKAYGMEGAAAGLVTAGFIGLIAKWACYRYVLKTPVVA